MGRQCAVFHADDEHVAELPPLGAVQAHQPHLVAGVVLVGVGEQGERCGQFGRTGSAPAVSAGLLEPVAHLVQVAAADPTQPLTRAPSGTRALIRSYVVARMGNTLSNSLEQVTK